MRTTALDKICKLKKRIWVIQGGQGAGKTIGILLVLINHASSHANREIIIASSELSKMRITVIKDFISVMKDRGLFDRERFTGGVLYSFQNGSFIRFVGLDKIDVGKGLRSDVLFVNEANKCKFEEVREIMSRAKKVIFDYNPNAKFWVDEEIKPRADAETLVLTYKDNEYLSTEEVNEIELYKTRGFINPNTKNYDTENNIKSNYWANKWRVYGLGQYGQIENAIYTDWKLGTFDETLPAWFGLDFGFSNDPDALIKIAIDEKRSIIYAKEEIYKTRQSQDMLIENLKSKVKPNELVIADSAEPRLINDLRKHFNIQGAIKWKIIERIKKIQSYTLVVDPMSNNLQTELENYIWSDKKAELPIDKYNHLLDALAYAVTGKNNFQFHIK